MRLGGDLKAKRWLRCDRARPAADREQIVSCHCGVIGRGGIGVQVGRGEPASHAARMPGANTPPVPGIAIRSHQCRRLQQSPGRKMSLMSRIDHQFCPTLPQKSIPFFFSSPHLLLRILFAAIGLASLTFRAWWADHRGAQVPGPGILADPRGGIRRQSRHHRWMRRSDGWSCREQAAAATRRMRRIDQPPAHVASAPAPMKPLHSRPVKS